MITHGRKGFRKLFYLYLTLLSATHAMDGEQQFASSKDVSPKVTVTTNISSFPKSCLEIEKQKDLINKGTGMLGEAIIQGKSLDELNNKIEYFENAGYKYSRGLLDRKITKKSIKNGFRSMYNYGLSFLNYDMAEQYKVVEQETQHTLARRAKLESLISIVWALTDYAQKKGQSFASGSFSIDDPKSRLFHLFEEYALFANGVDTLDKLPYGVFNCINFYGGSSFTYDRKPDYWGSTHYTHTSIEQFGIDAQLEGNASPLPILPYNMTHVLVGRVRTYLGKEKTFVKFEPHGTGNIFSTFMHTFDLLYSMMDKAEKRSEKKIHEEVQERFKDLTELMSKVDMSKVLKSEGVDPKIQLMLNSMIEYPKSLKDKEGTPYDIASFIEVSNHIYKTTNNGDVKLKADQLMKSIFELYSSNIEELSLRSGNEVVIDIKDIMENKLPS